MIRRKTSPPRSFTSKGINNPNRLLTPKIRRPGSDHWEEISWDQAIQGIARHIKNTRDRTFVGTGMGLAISRSIIESHHGTLWAVANEMRGATFHFSLPADAEGKPPTEAR